MFQLKWKKREWIQWKDMKGKELNGNEIKWNNETIYTCKKNASKFWTTSSTIPICQSLLGRRAHFIYYPLVWSLLHLTADPIFIWKNKFYSWLFLRFISGDSWMYPVFNVPRHGKSLYKPHNTWVFLGKLSPRIPRLNAINTMVVHVCYGYIQLSLDSSHYLQAFIHHNWWSPTWDVWANLGMNRALKKPWGNHGINRISNTQCLGETPDAPDQSQQL